MAVRIVTKKGRPITASRTAVSRRTPFVPNAKDTSADAATFIRQAPAPFTNRMTAAQVPAPANQTQRNTGTGRGYQGTSKPSYKQRNAESGGQLITNVGCGNTSLSASEMAAIGYSPNATKSSNSIISGHPNVSSGQRRRANSGGRVQATETGARSGDGRGTRNMNATQGPMYTQGRPGSHGRKRGS